MTFEHGHVDHRHVEHTFLKPVALTTSGIVVRGYKPHHSKYLIVWSSTGAQQSMSKFSCDEIDEYLKTHEPLDNELFTI